MFQCSELLMWKKKSQREKNTQRPGEQQHCCPKDLVTNLVCNSHLLGPLRKETSPAHPSFPLCYLTPLC